MSLSTGCWCYKDEIKIVMWQKFEKNISLEQKKAPT